MSYKERLRQLKYISASGSEFTLLFDELSRSGGKKAPVSEFPGQDQGAVQDLGEETSSFPITCYITGSDYDREADRLWDALRETGPAQLVHPRWGNINVLPTTREQREQFVDGAGRAVFTITFLRVNDESFTYPTAEAAPDEQISADVDVVGDAISEGVPEEIEDPRKLAALKENVLGALDAVKGAFDTVTGTITDAQSAINQTIASIESEIDSLVQAPADLMSAMLSLYRLPGRTIADVKAKIDGYKTLYSDLVDGFIETTQEYGEDLGLIQASQAAAIQGAAAESILEGLVLTRDEISRILDNLNSLNDDINSSVEEMEEKGGFSADYRTRILAQQAATAATTNLIDRALFLPAEKIEKIDEDKTILQFVYEKYGDLDRLDDIITYNNLGGDDLLLLPIGSEVAYYE